MLTNGESTFSYDSANRLIKAGGHTYTYNAEDVRIRNLCADADTTYTYDTNCQLSQLLCKTTNGITTKYVYGNGLIGEEKCGEFKTYHFDFRGSTVAITNANGTITDTFEYDTYGNITEHIGNSFVIFGYNGRDGVVTDKNGLIYMRARYYSPDMRRFINADIIPGEISNAITLNRYAYANGNPVSNTDPFGLSPDGKGSINLIAVYKMLKNVKSKKDKELASEMLAGVLDQLLSFRHIVDVSVGGSITIPVGFNASVTYTFSGGTGDGIISDNIIISDQLDLAESFDFQIGDNGSISIESDGRISVSVGYSANVDDYTTIEASVSAGLDRSVSAKYAFRTRDEYDNFVTTSIEFTQKTAPLNKAPAFVPELVPVPCYDPAFEKAPNAAKKDNPSHSTPTKDWSLPGFWDPVPSGAPSMDLSLEQATSFLLLAGLGGILLRKAYTGP